MRVVFGGYLLVLSKCGHRLGGRGNGRMTFNPVEPEGNRGWGGGNGVCTSQRKQTVFVTKTKRLMLFIVGIIINTEIRFILMLEGVVRILSTVV